MNNILEKYKQDKYKNVKEYGYVCPICESKLYSVTPIILKVLDGNRNYYCENDETHKFWKNARETKVLHRDIENEEYPDEYLCSEKYIFDDMKWKLEE